MELFAIIINMENTDSKQEEADGVEGNFPTLGPIIIGTSDIEKAKEFYTKVFGLKIGDQSENYLSAIGVDGVHIELEEDSDNRFPNWKENNVGTYKNSEFSVQDIFSFFESVKENGGSVVSEPVARPWGGYGGEIADLDGNIFLISQKSKK
jgi:predicted enzyme related to lactoylglutathione lyase